MSGTLTISLNPSNEVNAHGEQNADPFPPDFDLMRTGSDIAKFETNGGASSASRLRCGFARYDLSALIALGDIEIINAEARVQLAATDYGFGLLAIFEGGELVFYGGQLSEFAAEWMDTFTLPIGSEIYATDDTAQDALAPHDLAQYTDNGQTNSDTNPVDVNLPLLNATAHLLSGATEVGMRFACVGTPGVQVIGGINFRDAFFVNDVAPVLEIEYIPAGLVAEAVPDVEIEAEGVLTFAGRMDFYHERDVRNHRARLRRGGS